MLPELLIYLWYNYVTLYDVILLSQQRKLTAWTGELANLRN